MQLVVVDTNVLVAGLLTANSESPTARILNGMLNGAVLFFLSPALLAEYRAVLLRPKLAALHGLNEAEVETLLTELIANALWREPEGKGNAPDPKDDHLWLLLDQEPSAVLVTGDQLLLDEPHSPARVVRPSDYFRTDDGFAD
jgi:putative PIN family toxin of toxin-antitoxin system